MVTIFFSYSHKDEDLRDRLEVQLTMLKRKGVIETWHDRRIGAGEDFARKIDQHVETGDIILLLASPDFLASNYCYEKEMTRALARHDTGEAIVIPVILRPCMWQDTPFAKLQATPKNGTPVTMLPNHDQAFLEVAETIKAAAGRLTDRVATVASAPKPMPRGLQITEDRLQPAGPRSSNLAVAKQFTQRDKDTFELASFEYLARFFENSAIELQQRNPGIEATVRRIDANRFTAAIYKGGQAVSRCAIFIGQQPYMGSGIRYSTGDTGGNSWNEELRVVADEQSLYLQSMGMAAMGGQRASQALSQEGAAELYWGMLMRPLQQESGERGLFQ